MTQQCTRCKLDADKKTFIKVFGFSKELGSANVHRLTIFLCRSCADEFNGWLDGRLDTVPFADSATE